MFCSAPPSLRHCEILKQPVHAPNSVCSVTRNPRAPTLIATPRGWQCKCKRLGKRPVQDSCRLVLAESSLALHVYVAICTTFSELVSLPFAPNGILSAQHWRLYALPSGGQRPGMIVHCGLSSVTHEASGIPKSAHDHVRQQLPPLFSQCCARSVEEAVDDVDHPLPPSSPLQHMVLCFKPSLWRETYFVVHNNLFPACFLCVFHTPLMGPSSKHCSTSQNAFLYEGQHAGESEAGHRARIRLQGDVLASDMAAFKAANPGGCLADFVRWHSPKDWLSDAPSGIPGRLSPRMSPEVGANYQHGALVLKGVYCWYFDRPSKPHAAFFAAPNWTIVLGALWQQASR